MFCSYCCEQGQVFSTEVTEILLATDLSSNTIYFILLSHDSYWIVTAGSCDSELCISNIVESDRKRMHDFSGASTCMRHCTVQLPLLENHSGHFAYMEAVGGDLGGAR